MPIPCAPNGGIANFDRKVAPISGVANRAKRTPLVVETAPSGTLPTGTLDATMLAIDHCAEQRDFSRFHLRLDPDHIRQTGIVALDREKRATRA